VNASNIKKFVKCFIKYLNRFTILTFPYLKGKEKQTGYKDIRLPKQTLLPVARSRKLGTIMETWTAVKRIPFRRIQQSHPSKTAVNSVFTRGRPLNLKPDNLLTECRN